jgi:hypothetical protein
VTTERFEERLMAELKTRVRERAQERQAGAESVAAGVDALVARQRGRPRLRLRLRTVAVPMGLAVVIATAVFTAANTNVGGATSQHLLYSVDNAAYAVQKEPTGIVKLTILDANGRPNVDEMRSDLANAGITARVLADVPYCQHPQSHPSPDTTRLPPADAAVPRSDIENGRLVYYIDPRSVVPGVTLSVMFGSNLRYVWMELSASNDVPTCLFPVPSH